MAFEAVCEVGCRSALSESTLVGVAASPAARPFSTHAMTMVLPTGGENGSTDRSRVAPSFTAVPRGQDGAVLSADNKILYATRAGELADARRMSETGMYTFFENVVRTAKARP